MMVVHLITALEVFLITIFFVVPTVSIESFLIFSDEVSPLVLINYSTKEGDLVLGLIVLFSAFILPAIRSTSYLFRPNSTYLRVTLFLFSRLVLLEPIAIGCIIAITKFKSSISITMEVGFFILLFVCVVSFAKDWLIYDRRTQVKHHCS